jgi:protein-S-isoprenylcysteine O-methyltransferase Ste14
MILKGTVLRWWIFALVSVGLVAFSWRALGNPRSHGFYRFFAFEGIAAVVVLNADRWFSDPLSPLQIPSWALLLLSLLLVIHGFILLRTAGRPKGGIENTQVLVRRGAYRYIRHPLYASLLALGWGAALKNPSVPAIALALMATGALVLTASAEENECVAKFGDEYREYMRHTRRFIPFVY